MIKGEVDDRELWWGGIGKELAGVAARRGRGRNCLKGEIADREYGADREWKGNTARR